MKPPKKLNLPFDVIVLFGVCGAASPLTRWRFSRFAFADDSYIALNVAFRTTTHVIWIRQDRPFMPELMVYGEDWTEENGEEKIIKKYSFSETAKYRASPLYSPG